MKIDLSAFERAYLSNSLRRRIIQIQNWQARREAPRAAEFTKEMEMAEALAVRLDDGDSSPASKPSNDFESTDRGRVPITPDESTGG